MLQGSFERDVPALAESADDDAVRGHAAGNLLCHQLVDVGDRGGDAGGVHGLAVDQHVPQAPGVEVLDVKPPAGRAGQALLLAFKLAARLGVRRLLRGSHERYAAQLTPASACPG